MIYIDTHSEDVFYNFGAEYYFATHNPGEDVFLMWRTSPTLMIGKFQNTLEEIDASYARERGITVVRRMSGGGTIYTDMGGWQFSYITASDGIQIQFDRFISPIVEHLRSMGLDAAATGRNDITVSGKKVSGNAQFRLGAMTVHHGSLLYSTDIDELVRATTPKEYKITSKSIKSVRDRVTNISEHLSSPMSPEDFRASVVSELTDSVYEITPEDDREIRRLADEKFRDEKIIYGAVPKFEIEKTLHLGGGTFVIGLSVKKGIIEDAGVTGDFFSSDTSEDGNFLSVLRGIEYSPTAVRAALQSAESHLFGATADELTNGIFE